MFWKVTKQKEGARFKRVGKSINNFNPTIIKAGVNKKAVFWLGISIIIIIIIIIYRFLERHILKALWRFTILKINKKLQKTIKSLFKKKGLKAPFECVKNLYAHPTYLCFGPFCKFFGDF